MAAMLGLRLFLLVVFCAGIANAGNFMSINDSTCLKNGLHSATRPINFQSALKLQQNYKLVVRYTDHLSNATAKITESNFTDTLVIRKEQQGVEETFIIKNNTIRYKSGECSVVDSNATNPVYNVTEQLRVLFNNSAANMLDFVTGINNANFDTELLNETIQYVDGINVISWTGCVNQTNTTNAVELVVNFATEKSKPSYSDYAFPAIVSIRMIVFRVDNWENSSKIEHMEELSSLNVVELEHTRPEQKQEHTQVPRGIFCTNMTKSRYPTKLPQRFQTRLEYVDTDNKVTDRVDLTYDEQNQITSFALDFSRDADVPYVQNSDAGKMKGKARIVQDFKSGFEYILSRDGRVCHQVEPIQKTWANIKEINDKLILREPTGVFFNISRRPVYYAGQVVEEEVTYDSYVSRKYVDSSAKDYIVVELLFTQPDWTNEENKKEQQIHSIVQYHKSANHTLIKKTVIRFNSLQNNTKAGISWSARGVQPCMLDVPVDNFFFFKMADVNMKDIQNYGYENVENALANAISQSTNISILRVSPFLFKTVENELLACFLLGEKNNATPAQTKVLINEKTIQEVRQILNDTLKTQKIIVSFLTDDLVEKKLSLTALGMISTKENIQPTPFYGYSGGSMFILGIFMFIFGAGGAVGAYLLYMKRQSVRGIAYQVFE